MRTFKIHNWRTYFCPWRGSSVGWGRSLGPWPAGWTPACSAEHSTSPQPKINAWMNEWFNKSINQATREAWEDPEGGQGFQLYLRLQWMNESINQSMNQSIIRWMNQSTNRLVNTGVLVLAFNSTTAYKQSINELFNSINHSMVESIN